MCHSVAGFRNSEIQRELDATGEIDARIAGDRRESCVLNAEVNVIVPPPGTGSGTVFKLVPLTIHWNAVLYEFVPSVTVTWLLKVLGSAANGEMVPVIKSGLRIDRQSVWQTRG